MYKIAFLIPDEALYDTVHGIVREHDARWKTDHEGEFACSVHVAKNYRSIPRQVFGADVLIARGLIVTELQKIHPSVNLIEVPIGSEMVATVLRAVDEHGKAPIAIIGSVNIYYASDKIGDILGLDIIRHEQTSNEDYAIKKDVDRLLADGRKILICGPVTHRYASTLGPRCHPYILGMSKESVWGALSQAKNTAVIRRREKEKNAQFQAVLSAAREGIIVTDDEGRITICNGAAAKAVGISAAKAIGEGIWKVLPQANDVRENTPGKVIALGGKHVSVKKHRVALGRDSLGMVMTLLPVE